VTATRHGVTVEAGAGECAHYSDDAYRNAGAQIGDAAAAYGAQIVLKVASPTADELPLMKPGAVLAGILDPFDTGNAERLAAAGVTAACVSSPSRRLRPRDPPHVDAGRPRGLLGRTVATLIIAARWPAAASSRSPSARAVPTVSLLPAASMRRRAAGRTAS
jgi:hypothetical protein